MRTGELVGVSYIIDESNYCLSEPSIQCDTQLGI
jgi:hypothetical protein